MTLLAYSTGNQLVNDQRARYSERAAAAMIDLFFFAILWTISAAVVYLSFGFTAINTTNVLADDFRQLAFAGTLFVAFFVCDVYLMLSYCRRGSCNGQSLGKQMMRIKVVDSYIPNYQLWADSVFKRELVYKQLFFTIGLILVIPFLLDVLWPLWDSEDRALHDIFAGTQVRQW